MTKIEMQQMMDSLYTQRVQGLPATALAEVFDRLIWCLADQGDSLLQVRESWLESSEKERVEIALAMDETYPFRNAEKMEAVLERIATRWPELRPRCIELIEARKHEG